MECNVYKFNTLGNYKYADVVAIHKGKWLLSRHKDRDTWETQGGHIENDETSIQTAKRELYEESGAIEFDIEPLCDYSISGSLNGVELVGNGQVYFAIVHSLGDLPPESEMERVILFDTLPTNLTYIDAYNEIFPIADKKRNEYI
jgi:8-oxo-dGTP diphosphatase